MQKICYKDLNRQIYIIGVPLKQLMGEITIAVVLIFIVQVKVIPVIAGMIIVHLITAKQYRKDDFWIRHLLYRLTIPERRLYRKNVSYMSTKEHNTEQEERRLFAKKN